MLALAPVSMSAYYSKREGYAGRRASFRPAFVMLWA